MIWSIDDNVRQWRQIDIKYTQHVEHGCLNTEKNQIKQKKTYKWEHYENLLSLWHKIKSFSNKRNVNKSIQRRDKTKAERIHAKLVIKTYARIWSLEFCGVREREKKMEGIKKTNQYKNQNRNIAKKMEQ